MAEDEFADPAVLKKLRDLWRLGELERFEGTLRLTAKHRAELAALRASARQAHVWKCDDPTVTKGGARPKRKRADG